MKYSTIALAAIQSDHTTPSNEGGQVQHQRPIIYQITDRTMTRQHWQRFQFEGILVVAMMAGVFSLISPRSLGDQFSLFLNTKEIVLRAQIRGIQSVINIFQGFSFLHFRGE